MHKFLILVALSLSQSVLAEQPTFSGEAAKGTLSLVVMSPVPAVMNLYDGTVVFKQGNMSRMGISYLPKAGECTLDTVWSAPKDSPQAFITTPEVSLKPGTVLDLVFGSRSHGSSLMFFKIGGSPNHYDATLTCGGISDSMNAEEAVKEMNISLAGIAELK